jgi:SHS2 domain-containing protein
MISMFKYNILTEEVKSDFAFEVYSDTVPELFKGAGIAMMQAMINTEKISSESSWEFELRSDNLELMLYDFLGELIYLKDVEAAVFNDFEIKMDEIDNCHKLSCKAKGVKIDYDEHEMLTDIKAVTMHKFVLERRENEWYAHVIVDL